MHRLAVLSLSLFSSCMLVHAMNQDNLGHARQDSVPPSADSAFGKHLKGDHYNDTNRLFPHRMKFNRVETVRGSSGLTREHIHTVWFPKNNYAFVWDMPIPQDPEIESWVERMTFTNLPATPGLDWISRPKTLTEFAPRTRDVVCASRRTHAVTIQPHGNGISDDELWATEMIFHKSTHGFACHDRPPYPSTVSRCMAMYTTPWTADYSMPVTNVQTSTDMKWHDNGMGYPHTFESTSTSFSTWPVTVTGAHWGNPNPEGYLSARATDVSHRECHDEISCYDVCERESDASLRMAIILGAVFGGLLLSLVPIIYFCRPPKHLQRWRENAKARRNKQSSGQFDTSTRLEQSENRVPRPNRNPAEPTAAIRGDSGVESTKEYSAPKRLSTGQYTIWRDRSWRGVLNAIRERFGRD